MYNYRPISILPCFSKIFLTIIANRLLSFLLKYNILCDHKFGFIPGKNTTHAILSLVDDSINSFENNKLTCGISPAIYAQGDEAKTAELAPSGFDVKSFPRQSRSRGGGIATVYKSTLGSSITFKTSFDFTHTSFEVVQASITLQHNILHFFCLYRPPPNRRNNLTDSMFTEQLPDLLDYVNSLPGLVCLVGDMNIHFDNPLQSLTKQTLSTLSLYGLVQVINKPTHRSLGYCST